MKNVKMLLTALTIVAAVGGAFAFNAAKTNGTKYCTTTQFDPCPTSHKFSVVTAPNGSSMFCRDITGTGTCDTRTQVSQDD